jgi:hypothetical protein
MNGRTCHEKTIESQGIREQGAACEMRGDFHPRCLSLGPASTDGGARLELQPVGFERMRRAAIDSVMICPPVAVGIPPQ